jgi:hypothetical protein
MHHLSRSIFLILHLLLFLSSCFFLLLFDHRFDHGCFSSMLIVLVVEHFFSLHFFFFSITDFLFNFFTMGSLIFVYVLLLSLFHSFVVHYHILLFHLLLIHSLLFFRGSIHISTSLVYNIIGLFPCLINLFVGSIFLLFQKTDSITQ